VKKYCDTYTFTCGETVTLTRNGAMPYDAEWTGTGPTSGRVWRLQSPVFFSSAGFWRLRRPSGTLPSSWIYNIASPWNGRGTSPAFNETVASPPAPCASLNVSCAD